MKAIFARIFADLLAHQVSMLTGVMEGVRALLYDLSPEKIASDLLEGKRRAPAGAIEFGPFRVWALWRGSRCAIATMPTKRRLAIEWFSVPRSPTLT